MADDRLVGRRLGGFEVIDVLGRGGFGTVYRARQVRLGRDVALKVLDPMLARDADAARRFDREGWAAAGLDHPAIVPVYEAGEQDGIWYLAMRLVNGRSLAEALATTGPPPLPRTLVVVATVADALDHAHGRGVLHRDVKPANILLEDGRVWLADFGIAAIAQKVGAYTSGAIGTGNYMAPEQARPGEADARTDFYALSCVVFECVTGHVPYTGRDIPALLYAHAYDPIPLTGNPALDAFFARGMAKAPADRFQSGAELAAEFESVAGELTTPAVTTMAPASQATLDQAATVSTAAPTPNIPAPPTPAVPVPLAHTVPPTPATAPRPARRRILLALVAVIAAGALVGGILIANSGGGGGNAARPTTIAPTTAAPMTKPQAGDAYRAAVAPVNSAEPPFSAQANTWNASTPHAVAQSQSAALVAALEQVQPKLLSIADTYPPAAADLRADAEATAQLRRDLLELVHLNVAISVSTFRQQYQADRAKLIAASNAVRSDLALAPTAS